MIDDGKLDVEERETPIPGPYDVVVAVRAAGINAADLMQREGHYPAPRVGPPTSPAWSWRGS